MRFQRSTELLVNHPGQLSGARNDTVTSEHNLNHGYELPRNRRGIRSVNVTSDNRYLIITFEGKPLIKILDLEKLEFLPVQYQGHMHSIRLTSIAKDNKSFFTASWDGTFRCYDIISGECHKVLIGTGRSPSCYLDRDHQYLFTGSYDSDVDPMMCNAGKCWDLNTGQVIQHYHHQPRNDVECIDIAYDGKFVYTGSDDGVGQKWQVMGSKAVLKYFEVPCSVRKIAVSDTYFAAACTDGRVRLYVKETGEEIACLEHEVSEVREVRFNHNETLLYSAAGGVVTCYELPEATLLYRYKIHNGFIWSLCLMNNDRTLVTGSIDGSVAFISVKKGELIARLRVIPLEEDVLITCPSDKSFPNGFFYTSNRDRIKVVTRNSENIPTRVLEKNDPRRTAYIDELNLKHLMLARLKDQDKYERLSEVAHRQKTALIELNEEKRLRFLSK